MGPPDRPEDLRLTLRGVREAVTAVKRYRLREQMNGIEEPPGRCGSGSSRRA